MLIYWVVLFLGGLARMLICPARYHRGSACPASPQRREPHDQQNPVPGRLQRRGAVQPLPPIPADRHRCHYVKAKVTVRRRTDGSLAIFHGPRKLADYEPTGQIRTADLKAVA